VRPDGTARTRVFDLNGFSIWDWLPNGSLVTVADFGGTNGWVLLTVHSDGSGLAKLSPPVAQGDFIGSVSWLGDASRVAFGIYDSDAAAVTPLPSQDLFTARPDGTGLVQLNDVPLVGQGAGGAFWAPDGSRIVYQGPQVIGGIVELFSVRSDGTGRVRLNADLSPGGEVVGLIWSPDSSRVVFRPAQSINDGNLRYQASDAFTVRADGTDRVKLNASLAPGRTVSDPVNWAPDGSRLIYTELQYLSDRVGSSDTFSVLPDGTGRVKLNPDTASQYGATWSPDGARLLYEMTDQSTGRITLGLSHPDGTGLVTIKEWNPGEGGPGSFRWVP
jgi:Tol biopolymer transport system component